MQPNPPQPGFPQDGPPPMPGRPSPVAVLKPRAHAVAAVVAGVLAALTAGSLVLFALDSGVHASGPSGRWTGLAVENVLGGLIGAGPLLVAAGFTVARRIPGVWTLFGLCVLYVVAILVGQPLVGSTTFGHQLTWVFGFHKLNGALMGLATIFGLLTAITAAIAADVKSPRPATAPRR